MTTNQAFTILSRAGGIRAARIITENTEKLTRFNVWRMARALRHNVPVAKIIHQKWFWGLKFYTNRHTLDPRPDTETLVSAVLDDNKNAGTLKILDIGTGTGCIIISLAHSMPNAIGVGIDISAGARRVARKNAHNLITNNRVKIIHGDFRSVNRALKDDFDIIVTNPPYIAKGDSRVDNGAIHDPKIALYSGTDGLDAYRQIATNARTWIHHGGKIYLEIGAGQSRAVKKIFENANWGFIRAEKDLAGITRVLVFIYPGQKNLAQNHQNRRG